jgi:hypothetical protein
MTTPVVRRCPDGHYRRVVYDIGPFIADYPEQVMLAGVVQGWCARCGILLFYPRHWHAYSGHSIVHLSCRCTSKSSDLDGGGGRRTRALTDLLVSSPEISSAELWDAYGIDDDIIVSTSIFFWCINNSTLFLSDSRSLMTFRVPTSTKVFHRTYCIKSSRVHSRITL